VRVITLFLLILFSCNSFAKPAWEIPYDQQKWYWVYFAWLKEKNTALLTDFTKIEKIGENLFIHPSVLWDLKKNKFADKIEWYRTDCGMRKTERIKSFEGGSFTMFSNSEPAKPGTNGEQLMFMVCGVKNPNLQTIFGVGGILDGEFFTPIGIILEEVELNVNNKLENSINFKIHRYSPQTGKTGIYDQYTFDCKKKTIFDTKFEKDEFDIENSKVTPFKYPAELSCTYAEKNLWIQNNNKENTNIKNKSLTSIDEAKDKCKTLGFKPGTEKFGTCVLELTK
jgi:hypothetical protein